MERSQQNNLKKAFRDIKNGFSEIKVFENFFYLKHISFEDQVNIDSIYDKYLQQAVSRGVPLHDDVSKNLIEEKQWSDKQESEIKQQELFLDNLYKQKKSLFLKSEIERVNKDISEAQKKLNDLKKH